MTVNFSYVISLLANLNARGQSSSVIHMIDISTPQIAVGSPQQRTVEEARNVATESVAFSSQRGTIEISAHV
jgi:hypothetical protein